MRRTAVIRIGLALAVFAMGTVDVLSALLSHPPERLVSLEHLLPTTVLETSRTFTFLAGGLLLLAAWGLARGKRRAFVFALFLCAISVPVNVLKALDVEEATVAAFLLFALGVNGEAFRVRSRELSWRGWGRLALGAGAALLVAATVGAAWAEARFGGVGGVSAAFGAAMRGLVGLGPDIALPHPADVGGAARTARWIAGAMPVAGTVFAFGLALLALGPATYRRRHGGEHRKLEEILRAERGDAVPPYLLSPDLDVFLSANERAAIVYRFESGVLLAVGDPVGPPEDRPSLLAAFETFCRERDWRFAVFAAEPARLSEYAARGWRAVRIGVEPWIDPAGFTLEGSAMGDVRRAAKRLADQGLRVRSVARGTPLEGALANELRAISAEWLAAHPGGEKGFGMSRFDPRALARSWTVAALGADGHAVAFVTWAPLGGGAYALDLMRRGEAAPAGVMDFLVAESVRLARESGATRLSLGLAPLADTGATADPELARARAFLRKRLEPFYDFDGLFHWKKKFAPSFEDRFLVVPGASALPAVLYALARAQSPGGFRASLRAARRARPVRKEAS